MKRIAELGLFPLILGGHILWGAGFFALYSTHASGCELGWHEAQFLGPLTALRLLLVVMSGGMIAALALLAAGVWRLRGTVPPDDGPRSFAIRAGRYSMLAALGSVVLTFFVVFLLPLC